LVPVIYLVLALGNGGGSAGPVIDIRSLAIRRELSVWRSLALAWCGVETGLLARIDGAAAPYTIAQAIGIPGAARSGRSTRRTRNPIS
jgi:hypothetical protein